MDDKRRFAIEIHNKERMLFSETEIRFYFIVNKWNGKKYCYNPLSNGVFEKLYKNKLIWV